MMSDEIRIQTGVRGAAFDTIRDHAEEVGVITEDRIEVDLGNDVYLELTV